jgi:hypothetical protein
MAKRQSAWACRLVRWFRSSDGFSCKLLFVQMLSFSMSTMSDLGATRPVHLRLEFPLIGAMLTSYARGELFSPMDPKPTFHNFSNLNPNEAPASPTRLLVSCCRSGLPKKRNGPVIMVKKALLPQHQGQFDGTCAVYSVLKRLHAAVRSFGKAG